MLNYIKIVLKSKKHYILKIQNENSETKIYIQSIKNKSKWQYFASCHESEIEKTIQMHFGYKVIIQAIAL